jgi:hypothetical protein
LQKALEQVLATTIDWANFQSLPSGGRDWAALSSSRDMFSQLLRSPSVNRDGSGSGGGSPRVVDVLDTLLTFEDGGRSATAARADGVDLGRADVAVGLQLSTVRVDTAPFTVMVRYCVYIYVCAKLKLRNLRDSQPLMHSGGCAGHAGIRADPLLFHHALALPCLRYRLQRLAPRRHHKGVAT